LGQLQLHICFPLNAGTCRTTVQDYPEPLGEKMSARHILLRVAAAAICFTPTLPAAAQTLPNIYVRADAGWSKTADGNFQDVNFPDDHVITGTGGKKGVLKDYGGAWLLGAGLGMRFSPRFRGDIVYTYRGTYRLDEFDQAVLPNAFHANITSHSVMLTGYADFPILDSGVIPFLGAGVGWASNTLDSLSWQPTSTANITPVLRVAPGATADRFAWQATVGISFLLSNVLALDFSYKYFNGGDVRSGAGNILANGVAIGTYSGGRGSFAADEITASIRYYFGSL
jgi:opacity protein-like surface antigen